MKFYISKVSDDYYKDVKEFNTIDELMKFCKANDDCLCIHRNWYSEYEIPDMVSWGTPEELAKEIVSCEYEIEIYDDYRE